MVKRRKTNVLGWVLFLFFGFVFTKSASFSFTHRIRLLSRESDPWLVKMHLCICNSSFLAKICDIFCECMHASNRILFTTATFCPKHYWYLTGTILNELQQNTFHFSNLTFHSHPSTDLLFFFMFTRSPWAASTFLSMVL